MIAMRLDVRKGDGVRVVVGPHAPQFGTLVRGPVPPDHLCQVILDSPARRIEIHPWALLAMNGKPVCEGREPDVVAEVWRSTMGRQ